MTQHQWTKNISTNLKCGFLKPQRLYIKDKGTHMNMRLERIFRQDIQIFFLHFDFFELDSPKVNAKIWTFPPITFT